MALDLFFRSFVCFDPHPPSEMDEAFQDIMCPVGLFPDFGSEREYWATARDVDVVSPGDRAPLHFIAGNPITWVLPAGFCDNFFGNILWHGIVMRELHRIVGASAGHRTEVVHIAEHFSKGNKAPHNIHHPAALHT
jgi:hypothetical protein